MTKTCTHPNIQITGGGATSAGSPPSPGEHGMDHARCLDCDAYLERPASGGVWQLFR